MLESNDRYIPKAKEGIKISPKPKPKGLKPVTPISLQALIKEEVVVEVYKER